MKNFPHQYNDLRKLRATLKAVADLFDEDIDATDDGTLGYELARRRIYTFRGIDYENNQGTLSALIERRISTEQARPAADQGARTAAREMRRTLRYLSWLNDQMDALTQAGEVLLTLEEGSDAETVLMQEGIFGISLADSSAQVSHPTQVLLRLIDGAEFQSRAGMELALEAVNDTPQELARVLRLARMSETERLSRLESLGWTKAQVANARKILPSFAERSGLILQSSEGRYLLTEFGIRALGRVPDGGTSLEDSRSRQTEHGQQMSRRRVPRGRSVPRSAPENVGKSRLMSGSEFRALSREEQELAAALLYERTERHQEIVRFVSSQSASGDRYEDGAGYDLVVDVGPGRGLVLFEIKTVKSDADSQVKRAVGQLLYYEYFQVASFFVGRDAQKALVVDLPIDRELAEFLDSLEIGLIVMKDNELSPANPTGKKVLEVIQSREN